MSIKAALGAEQNQLITSDRDPVEKYSHREPQTRGWQWCEFVGTCRQPRRTLQVCSWILADTPQRMRGDIVVLTDMPIYEASQKKYSLWSDTCLSMKESTFVVADVPRQTVYKSIWAGDLVSKSQITSVLFDTLFQKFWGETVTSHREKWLLQHNAI